MEDITPESSRVAKLTAKQRECLHLVVLRKSSKEIARILKISKPAVDQRLIGARKVLGASTRDEAALIYARASGTYDRILYDPVGAIIIVLTIGILAIVLIGLSVSQSLSSLLAA